MSERVERKIISMLGVVKESPYGNPIPGLEELGIEPGEEFLDGMISMSELASDEPVVVTIRRIGEPVQVNTEALALLTAAELTPGAATTVRREGSRVIAAREGRPESSGVSLPDDIASHVFVDKSAQV